MKQKLTRLCATTGVPLAVAANPSTGEVVYAGDPTEVRLHAPNDLFDTFFSDSECVAALYQSLEGQILPQIWSQGEVTCIVCKPMENLIVALFSVEERDPVALLQWSRQLDKVVSDIWPEKE